MIPADLRYTKSHEWVRVEGQLATVGITHFAQEQLTDIVFVELPDVGQVVEQGKECGVIESCKIAAEFYAPVSGTITAVNDELRDHPEYINQDAYGRGWIIKLELNNPSEAESLLSADDYNVHLEESK
jgi:glycine cleavage system H protein